jgi:hypothetical protein
MSFQNRRLVEEGCSRGTFLLPLAELYRQRITRILEWQPATPETLGLSADAYSMWKDFQRSVEREMHDGQRLCRLRDWGSKLPGAALRLATLLHVGRYADTLATLLREISEPDVRAAVQMCSGLISHAIAAFSSMSEDCVLANSKRVFRWLSEQERKEIPKRDCFRAHQPHVFQKVQELDECLNLLIRHHLIRVFERKTGGRSSELIQLNPRLRKPEAN